MFHVRRTDVGRIQPPLLASSRTVVTGVWAQKRQLAAAVRDLVVLTVTAEARMPSRARAKGASLSEAQSLRVR
jgi:hypothetical protein